MYWLVMAAVGIVVWGIMHYFMNGKTVKGGWIGGIVVSFAGAWLGDWLLGDWGWMLNDVNVAAGVIGAGVLGWLMALIFPKK